MNGDILYTEYILNGAKYAAGARAVEEAQKRLIESEKKLAAARAKPNTKYGEEYQEVLDAKEALGKARMDSVASGLNTLFPQINRTQKALGGLSDIAAGAGGALMDLAVANPTGTLVAVTGAAIAAVAAFGALTFSAGALTGAVSELVTSLAPLGSAALAGIGLGIAIPFMNAASAIETTRRQLIALMGDAEKGTRMFQFVREYGLKSGLEQGPLMEMVKILIMGSQDVNKMLPAFESIALAGGGDINTNANEIAEVIRYLVGGQYTHAMGPRGLGRFGINRKMLEGAGAKFDSQGSFKGSMQDAFDVISKLSATSPFLRDMKKLMDESPAVKLSNAMDALNYAIQGVGKSLLTLFLPPIESASKAIKFLADSGYLSQLASSFGVLFGVNGSKSSAAIFSDALHMIVGGLKELPSLILTVGAMVMEMVSGVMDMLKAAWNIAKYMALLIPGGQGIYLMMNYAEASFEHGYNRGKNAIKKFLSGAKQNAALSMAVQATMSGGPDPNAVAPMGPGMSNGIQIEQLDNLKKIEKHTQKMAQTFNDAIFGGGNTGLTAVEMNRMSGRGGSSSRIAHHIEQIIALMNADHMRKFAR